MRAFRHAATKATVDEILAEPRYGHRFDVFWCAADKPEGTVEVVPVYVGTKLPKDAACATCHIPLAELQADMKKTLDRAR